MVQQRVRKAIGALKDSTTVGLARVSSKYKELDIAIVKATNHVEFFANEKHIQTIFSAISASKPRADVQYCIYALARRIAKTQNWAVAIKTLIVLHRALREVDSSFQEELNNTRAISHILNYSHFKDDSSRKAWIYSSWARDYALYLEERLECFRVLKYDVVKERARTSKIDTIELLEHFPALQQLLFRMLGCQPEGTAILYNCLTKYAFSLVYGESFEIYSAIHGCTVNLVDNFFEMHRHDALRALKIYRKAVCQAERLFEFYEICNGLKFGRDRIFIGVELPPTSFFTAMEEYVKDTSRNRRTNQNMMDSDGRLPASEPIIAIEHENVNSDDENPEQIRTFLVPSEEIQAESVKAPVPIQTQVADLLDYDDFSQGAAKLEENNALALAIVSNNDPLDSTNTYDPTIGWELALVGAASSNQAAVAESKMAGGFDKLTLYSLYEDAISRRANADGRYHLGQVAPNPSEDSKFSRDPFCASNGIAAPVNVQMATMDQQQAFMMQRQQQQQQHHMGLNNTDPSGNPFGPAACVSSYPPYNPYVSLI